MLYKQLLLLLLLLFNSNSAVIPMPGIYNYAYFFPSILILLPNRSALLLLSPTSQSKSVPYWRCNYPKNPFLFLYPPVKFMIKSFLPIHLYKVFPLPELQWQFPPRLFTWNLLTQILSCLPTKPSALSSEKCPLKSMWFWKLGLTSFMWFLSPDYYFFQV